MKDSVFYAFKEAAKSLTEIKKFEVKSFSVLHLNVRSLNQKSETLRKSGISLNSNLRQHALQEHRTRIIQEMKHYLV